MADYEDGQITVETQMIDDEKTLKANRRKSALAEEWEKKCARAS
jgi:hypothetical protein